MSFNKISVVVFVGTLILGCSKEELSEPIDVNVINQQTTQPVDSNVVSTVKLRVDRLIFHELPLSRFWNGSIDKYRVWVIIRNYENIQLDFTHRFEIPTLPNSEFVYAEATNQTIRFVIEDNFDELYDVFELSPDNFKHQDTFDTVFEDGNGFKMQVMGIVIK